MSENKKAILCLDEKCITNERIKSDMFGGAERFCIKILKPWLESEGFEVVHFPQVGIFDYDYDIAFHSNVYDHRANAKRHILWCGSWHCMGIESVDVAIVISEFMKEKLGWKDAIVLPAPFDHNILKYRSNLYQPGLIMCHSNPNRHLKHTKNIALALKNNGEKSAWLLTGGNRLYCDEFHEQFSFIYPDGRIEYLGAVPRIVLIQKLTSANVWAYPILSADDETFCVAAAEALALGIPTVLTRRRPFLELFPEAEFASNEHEFVRKIECLLHEEGRWDKDMSRYDDRNVMPEYMKIVRGLL